MTSCHSKKKCIFVSQYDFFKEAIILRNHWYNGFAFRALLQAIKRVAITELVFHAIVMKCTI